MNQEERDSIERKIAAIRAEQRLRALGILMNCIAVSISWSLHKSVLWAFIHGFFGGFYIIYYLIRNSFSI